MNLHLYFYILHPVRDWQEKIVPCWMIVQVKEEMENQWSPLAATQRWLPYVNLSIAVKRWHVNVAFCVVTFIPTL